MKSFLGPAILGALGLVVGQPALVHAINFSVTISGPTPDAPVEHTIHDNDSDDLDPDEREIRFNFSSPSLGYTISGLALESPGSLAVDGSIGLTLTDLTVTGTAPLAFGRIVANSDLEAPYSPGGPLFGQVHLSGSYARSSTSTDIKAFVAQVETPIGLQLVGVVNPPDASMGLTIDEDSPLTQNFEPTIFGLTATLEFTVANGQGFNLPVSASFSVAPPQPVPESSSFGAAAAVLAGLMLWRSRQSKPRRGTEETKGQVNYEGALSDLLNARVLGRSDPTRCSPCDQRRVTRPFRW
jgi:hypothetical protein